MWKNLVNDQFAALTEVVPVFSRQQSHNRRRDRGRIRIGQDETRFVELDEQGAVGLFAVVFRRWVERRLSEPSPTLRRAIARLAWRDDGEGRDPLASLRKAGWSLVEWRDHPTPWTHRAVDRVAALDSIVGGLIHLGPPSRVQQESGLFVLRRERAFAWSP